MSMLATTNFQATRPTQQFKLRNGLTLLLRESHDVPVATADVWVGTGSAGETPEIGGISHFLEHMLFKGTEKFGLGEIEREIENHGGVCNAGTSYDFTHYYLTLPSENIRLGVQMLAEMVKSSSLDPTELEKERLVILEEYRRKQDNPEAMLFEDLYEQLHETGPYHRSVIGEENTIRSITRDQMMKYYTRHYAPENMTLVIAGDVTAGAAVEMANEWLGGYDRAYEPLVPRPEPTRFARAKVHHRAKPTGGEVYFALACGAPGATETDKIVPLDLAQCILGQGRASILFQEIKERRRLASTVSCYYSTHLHGSVFMVDATCEPEKQAELRAAIEELVGRFLAEPISKDQMTRARRLIGSSHLFSFETTSGAAVQTGYYHLLTKGTEFLDHYDERLQEATPEQVQRTLADALGNNPWVEISVGPSSNGKNGGAL